MGQSVTDEKEEIWCFQLPNDKIERNKRKEEEVREQKNKQERGNLLRQSGREYEKDDQNGQKSNSNGQIMGIRPSIFRKVMDHHSNRLKF